MSVSARSRVEGDNDVPFGTAGADSPFDPQHDLEHAAPRSRVRARGVPVSSDQRGISVAHGHATLALTCYGPGQDHPVRDLLSSRSQVQVLLGALAGETRFRRAVQRLSATTQRGRSLGNTQGCSKAVATTVLHIVIH